MGRYRGIIASCLATLATALATAAFGAPTAAAQGNDASTVARACAIEARHPTPDDPTGKLMDAMDPARAVPKCVRAFALNPHDPAVESAYGRALYSAKKYDEAFAHYKSAADKGDLQALALEANAYAHATGVPKDSAKAAALYRQAIDRGLVWARFGLALLIESGDLGKPDLAEVLRLYRKGGDDGDAAAMNAAGNAYFNGSGVAKDPAEAFSWHLRSAKAGEIWGMENTGWAYETGTGVTKDIAQAVNWYQRASDADNPTATRQLGWLYHLGVGVFADQTKAISLLEAAADKGDEDAFVKIAFIYDGNGMPKNVEAERQWLEKGAARGLARPMHDLAALLERTGADGDRDRVRQLYCKAALAESFNRLADLADAASISCLENAAAGSADAMYALARAKSFGPDAIRDDPGAVELLKRASALNNSGAMNDLAWHYATGRGVAIDFGKAFDQEKKASELGLVAADYGLALYYAQGSGVSLDPAKAADYFDRYAAEGGVDAKRQVADAYAKGALAPLDLGRARHWYAAALANGNKGAAAPLVRVILANSPTPADRSYVMTLLTDAARRRQGWAMAALAQPGPLLIGMVPEAMREHWRGEIGHETDADVLLDAAKALQSADLADQQFALAMRYAAAASDPMRKIGFQIKLMVDLGLQRAAMHRLAVFVRDPQFQAAPLAARAAFLASFDRDAGWEVDVDQVDEAGALSDAGLNSANLALASYYATGGPHYDPKESVRWYQRAMDRVSIAATIALANDYWNGAGVEPDHAKALGLWKAAADAGSSVGAQYLVSYYRGEWQGASVNRAQELHWLPLAAQGDAGAWRWASELYIAKSYLTDTADRSSDAKAISILLDDVSCGFNPARVMLAAAYASGTGVARDRDEALRWIKLAALYDAASDATQPVQRGAGAQAMVVAATLGWGMKPDVATARVWLGKAQALQAPAAADWLKACGADASLDCLRKQSSLQAYVLPAGAAGAPPLSSYEQRRAILTKYLQTSIKSGSNDRATYVAFRDLRNFYMMFGKVDELVSLELQERVVEEARADLIWGSRHNYFALIGSTCGWYSASKEAKLMGRPEAALFFAKMAVNRLQEARQRLADLPDELRECFVQAHRDRYRMLADLFMEMGHYGEAEGVLNMLKDFERYNYTRGDRRDETRTLLPLDADQIAANASFEAAVAALSRSSKAVDRLQELQKSGSELSASQQAEYQAAATLIEAANTDFRTQQSTLLKRLGAMDTKRAGSGLEGQRVSAVTPALIAQVAKLGPETAVLHAVVLPDRVDWLITTGRWQKLIPIAVSADTLRLTVGHLRAAIQSRSPDAAVQAKTLYDLIFSPVDATLREIGAKQILVSLDDCLRYVPFAALRDDKDWLVRRYTFAEFGSTTELYNQPTHGATWHIAGLGTTTAHLNFPALPSVATELDSLVKGDGHAGMLPGIYRIDQQFDDRTFKASISGLYQVVHLATHFSLDPTQSSKSFLLLGDGNKLTLDQLKADGGYTFNGVELLTLSACDTAMSAPDANGAEIESMAAQTQEMGARAVLASLWSVSDKSTADLMRRFYAALVAGAPSKSVALQTAQLAMLDGHDAAVKAEPGAAPGGAPSAGQDGATTDIQPYYWAPFILLGNWL